MNYRHGYHAGNFADVMKHVLLTRILAHLLKKDAAFRVIDTHAGIGLHDLDGEEAQRTGEWRDGIGRLEEPFGDDVEALLAPYRQAISAVRATNPAGYPGSPMITRLMLRRQDRAIVVERHPEDAARLAALFLRDRQVKALELDGWTALNAMIPPKERRGLVLIDPPFEEVGELARLGREMLKAQSKWETGIFAGWYPIKDPADADRFADDLATGSRTGTLRLELMIETRIDPTRLNGCGLVVINPPWKLAEEAEILLPALAKRLARDSRAGFRCEWLREG
ncbi:MULTISPECIES: 23S rRNA (adenine(2030)-N(6))-methyltransferase RlmJ [unclassified Chelatococcus]|jgi:23S rRNA (adenine2030-N6)-methyltransferase|uniref:23S rRNA (adenine(2030)-N(6))-methyltransferase RlmJ n=1 Tax=unclassified Chelatococcus TaxID=2638111 RepID=UPI001BCFA59E|nr:MULTISPECIES: 23S rRNA (adenine(2030)-N(6))-methyltransferase RlmJ [unclassified Chelatococcus]CAH1665141.1 Ribosomal RNA large subunit methyltransferase J [Hyphomicrobiales bacterium]MBS7737677.1 23S rRNA (adenine(2030)-N(6))-methyltransferase RlmJ [Chelatococcus sp. HY11]MBX3544189.1 23S rRNA (adenine(2030)-N(6))-methyltransferase RlmJ [Chelatococcus sp.]MCO5079489.1 23S rRNA (adenine(2030)-N(6))-methyltransferase RlmJ [Chelatococcus sp.]CAH1681504.1 Ribosomal RNA large subunit methyltran